jgi:hypothetical protein
MASQKDGQAQTSQATQKDALGSATEAEIVDER